MLDAYSDSFASQQVRLDSRLQTGVRVKADEELLEVVLENVIDNALSVSPQYGTITIELKASGKQAALAIRDQGPGVPAPYLHRIFERYVSLRALENSPVAANDAESTAGRGHHLGIGLWIVRRNLEAVDGSVWVENRPGGGLAVNIDLPLAA
jgi:two-component system sensor histidine kinase ChvG